MHFEDTPEEAAFRAEARDWLAKAAAAYANPPTAPWEEAELVRLGRAWQRTKAEGGFAGILWPQEIGGRGGTPMQASIFDEEEHAYNIPTGVFITIGMNMAVPTIRRHGTPEQAERYTRPTLLGEMTWCQLFSEPAAGSDLANLRTKAAQRQDGSWLINGQKVWSSWAHHADYAILLTRTDPSVAKHKGLTFFVLDMKTPGITIRPIRQISGKSDFNEVFLENVVIPDANRIGKVGEGWACAMTTLMSERAGSRGGESDLDVATVIEALRGTDALADGAAQVKLARWWTVEQGIQNFRHRLTTRMSKGEPLGAEAALVKLAYARKLQDIAAFAMDVEGYEGVAGDSPLREQAEAAYQWGAVMRIAGGADEILKNQLSERVLGMPGEIRADKDIPFDQLEA
ncbi:MAG: acyl-CoA dehydrogenase [Caulobacter sp.]|nr:acyl-CoA dehydrogenase [Caulobacter sp.]